MKLAKAVHDAARRVATIVGDAKTASGRPVRDVLSVARESARRWVRDAYLCGYEDGVKDALTAALNLEPGRVHSPMPKILDAHAKGIAEAARAREAIEVAELRADEERAKRERTERDAKQREAIEKRVYKGNADPIGLHSMVEGNRDDKQC